MSVVERSARMPATPDRILPLISTLRNWREWSPWEGLDPNLQRVHGGPESGVGSTYTWQGNRDAGAGTMRVLTVTDDRVEVQVEFTKPFRSTSLSSFQLQGEGDSTLVTWTMTSPDTLLTRIAGKVFNLDKMLGKDIEKGLAGLAAAVR